MHKNLNDKLTAIMYHYVYDNNDNDFNYLKGITTEMLCSQIDKLSKKYNFISAIDYCNLEYEKW